ncbi:MAG: DUF2927 domain-containing protein [Gammaproteobacteria bacterium]|nr:DUF2927 domain-containing protein [Gammaproteobacteria bacterium]
MADERTQSEQWLFVAALSVLGATFVWQMLGDPESPPPPPPTPVVPETIIEPKVYLATPGGLYSTDELNYFREVAFGSEHESITEKIRKWTSDVNIRIEGDPSAEDLVAVKSIAEQINSLQDQVHLSIGYFDTSLVIQFAPQSRFEQLHTKYRRGNPGFFFVAWIEEEIYRGTILIDTEDTNQAVRNALITEELTQALGLMNTSNRYSNSIFNDDHILPELGLSDMDETMLKMLYRPAIIPGMDVTEAMEILRGIMPPQTKDS